MSGHSPVAGGPDGDVGARALPREGERVRFAFIHTEKAKHGYRSWWNFWGPTSPREPATLLVAAGPRRD